MLKRFDVVARVALPFPQLREIKHGGTKLIKDKHGIRKHQMGKLIGFRPTAKMREWIDEQVRHRGCSISYICKAALLKLMESQRGTK